jgi:UMF1 family MFS transporter
VLAWALWDVGSTGVNAIVVTFVFSVYLTRTVGDDLPSTTTPQSWLFRALAVSGLVVALLAPVTGSGSTLRGDGDASWPSSPGWWSR